MAKGRPGAADDVQVGSMVPTIKKNCTYEVVHTRVAIRTKPSTKAAVIGVTPKGGLVRGNVFNVDGEEWVRLDDEVCDAVLGQAPPEAGAWMLIHGGSVGLGVLLEETQQTFKPPPRKPAQKPAAATAATVRSAWLTCFQVTEPAVWVLPKADANQQRKDCLTSKFAGEMVFGDAVSVAGHQWLRTEHKGQEAWMLIDGKAVGTDRAFLVPVEPPKERWTIVEPEVWIVPTADSRTLPSGRLGVMKLGAVASGVSVMLGGVRWLQVEHNTTKAWMLIDGPALGLPRPLMERCTGKAAKTTPEAIASASEVEEWKSKFGLPLSTRWLMRQGVVREVPLSIKESPLPRELDVGLSSVISMLTVETTAQGEVKYVVKRSAPHGSTIFGTDQNILERECRFYLEVADPKVEEGRAKARRALQEKEAEAAKRRAEEEARQRQAEEEERRRKEAEEAKRRREEEEARRQREEEEARKRQEEERKRQEEEAARRRQQEEEEGKRREQLTARKASLEPELQELTDVVQQQRQSCEAFDGTWEDEEGTVLLIVGTTVCGEGISLDLSIDGDRCSMSLFGQDEVSGRLSEDKRRIMWSDGTSWVRRLSSEEEKLESLLAEQQDIQQQLQQLEESLRQRQEAERLREAAAQEADSAKGPEPAAESAEASEEVAKVDEAAKAKEAEAAAAGEKAKAAAKKAAAQERARMLGPSNTFLGGHLRVPRCMAATWEEDNKDAFLLVLEMLEAPLWTGCSEDGCSQEQAFASIQALGRFHRAFQGSKELEQMPWLPVTTFNIENATFFEEQYCYTYDTMCMLLHSVFSATALEACSRLKAHYAEMVTRLAQPPLTLVHGDFHPNNFRFSSTSPPAVAAFDWQFACRGRGAYDFAYFIALFAPAEVRRAWENELGQCYLEACGRADEVAAFIDEVRAALLVVVAFFMMVNLSAISRPDMRGQLSRMLQRIGSCLDDWGCVHLL